MAPPFYDAGLAPGWLDTASVSARYSFPAIQPYAAIVFPQSERAVDAPVPDASTAREPAWLLTKSAATSARAGDCARVVQLASEVAALDAEFHATVFMRDIAIARCLDPSTATQH